VIGAAAPQADRIAVLAIAYHNIGVEQEFLKKFEQSILSYKKGVEVAERYLGAKHAICITLNNSLISAKKAASALNAKNANKKAKEITKKQHASAKQYASGQGVQKKGAAQPGRPQDELERSMQLLDEPEQEANYGAPSMAPRAPSGY
jgi:hypothetical protein